MVSVLTTIANALPQDFKVGIGGARFIVVRLELIMVAVMIIDGLLTYYGTKVPSDIYG